MKPTYSVHNKLIEKIGTTIEAKILTISEEEIDQIFYDIDTSADNPDGHNELYILEKLQIKCEEKIAYYQTMLHKKYDWNAFKYVILTSIIAIVVLYLLHILITHYNIPENKKLGEIIQELTEYDITLTDCSEGTGMQKSYYLDYTANRDLSYDEYLIAQNLLDRALEIHTSIYGWIRRTMIFIFWCILILSKPLFHFICKFLWPNYHQYYNKWHIVEEKIKTKISFLKRQSSKNKCLFDTRDAF